jgi:MYXO-CTERM domain-containing protein
MNSIKLSAAALIFTGSAFAGLDSASFTVEEAVSGYDTYRVFLNFTAPTDKLLAVNGDTDGGYNALSYSGGVLYNALLGNYTPDDTGRFAAVPTMAGDSYLTIGGQGMETSFSPGFLEDNGVGDPALGNYHVVRGSSFTWANNGGYFDSNPGSGAFDTGSGVLIAQLTVASGEDITFTGTASFNNADGNLSFANFAVTTVPAPGALALLGLAGLGRRRRG